MFREFRQAHGGTMVDLVSELGVKVAEGIIGQSSEMEHRVEAGEVTRLNIAQILVQAGDFNDFPDEAILSEKIAIEPNDFVGGLGKHSHQNGTDISVVACHKYSHKWHAPLSSVNQ
jgi:hypothetical protein